MSLQLYYPEAHWDAIRQLVQEVSIPVVGNGDIFEAGDAVEMMRETGCAGWPDAQQLDHRMFSG